MRALCPATHGEFVIGPAVEARWGDDTVEDPQWQWDAKDYYSPDETDWENRYWW